MRKSTIAILPRVKHFAVGQTYAEHDSMEMIAVNSGTKAFCYASGVKDWQRQNHEFQRELLHLAYAPTNKKVDRSYRTILIWPTQRNNLRIAYLIGYFAINPDTSPSNAAFIPGEKSGTEDSAGRELSR